MCNDKQKCVGLVSGDPLAKTVKETIDFVYEFLAPHPEGIVMNAKSLGAVPRSIVTILVSRGILQKTYVKADGRIGVECSYKWAATMSPTKTLYGSVTGELRDIRKRRNEARKKSDHVVAQETVPQESPKEYVTTLDGFSSQELWDELKKRGYTIEDNRLVIIKKAYLT